ncbi:MAG: hypothetical protein H0U49_09205 [Parachlamydiaceae bacterium]|nr:hypothetical protein [Parachlamydiaceae bacterium]
MSLDGNNLHGQKFDSPLNEKRPYNPSYTGNSPELDRKKEYNFSKVGSFDSVFGRHFRLKEGKDGVNYVKIDTSLGKAFREALAYMGIIDKGSLNYVKDSDLSVKIGILNKAYTGEQKIENIAKRLTKEIIKNEDFYTKSAHNQLPKLNETSVKRMEDEQVKLYEQLNKDPMIFQLSSYVVDNKTITYSDALAELENFGVDLKKEKIEANRFIEKLVETKYAALPAIYKGNVLHESTSEIKEALKLKIIERYRDAITKEMLPDSKKDQVADLCYHLINDDYSFVIKDEEIRQIEVQNKLKEENPMVRELVNYIPTSSQYSFRQPPVAKWFTEEDVALFKFRSVSSELTKYGVNLKDEKIDTDKFISKLIEVKAKDNLKIDRGLLKEEIEARYMQIKTAESLKPMDEELVANLYNQMINDDYSYLLNVKDVKRIEMFNRLKDSNPIVGALVDSISKNVKYNYSESAEIFKGYSKEEIAIFKFSAIASELEKYGIDLKQGKIDSEKLIDNLVEDKVNNNSKSNRDLITKVLRAIYSQIKELEQKDPMDKATVTALCNHLISDPFNDLE